MSGKAKEVLSQLSISTTELTDQIDIFEENLSDIERMLTQFLPPKVYKMRHKRGLRHFADLILNFMKETARESLEKVTTCKNIAPGILFEFFHIFCLCTSVIEIIFQNVVH